MIIPAALYTVMSNEADRLLDRLHEAVALDFADARDNGASKPSPEVVAATEAAHDEYDRLIDMLNEAGGGRYLGHHRATLAANASLRQVREKAWPLLRKITHLLRHAEPQIESGSFVP